MSPEPKELLMGSKSSKWLAASLAATALAVVPAGAVAKLDYSRNSVSGQYMPPPARLVGQINDVPSASSPPQVVAPAAPVRAIVRNAGSQSGFDWGAALAGGAAALLLALSGMAIARRRHPSPLAS
jgi:hypothetical protein